jgi:methionyl-tRNA formyltransferase
LWEARHLSHLDTLATFAAYEPDVLCVACFSLRIPKSILVLPRLGSLNVHPSLLPANRGPVPLFWTFREGHRATGATIHLLDEGMDSGDILAQQVIEIEDAMGYEQLEQRCATVGATLLAQAVWDLYEGRAKPRPQDETRSSYHSFPNAEDFVVHASQWSARHVYNFLRGVGYWDIPITVYSGSDVFLTRDAISYSNKSELAPPPQEGGASIRVQCLDGWVLVEPR